MMMLRKPAAQLRASKLCCLLWSTSLFLPSVSSFGATSVATPATALRTVSLSVRSTTAWSRRPTASTFTMQLQTAASNALDEVGVESGKLQQQPEISAKRRGGYQHQAAPKQQPRVLKTIGPFSRSMEDMQYLAGAFAFLARHTSVKAAGTALRDGVNPLSLLMSAVWVPRVMALVSSSSPITVEEGIEMVSKDAATGEYKVNRLLSSKGGSERLAYLMLEDLNNVREGVYPIPSELRIENQVSTEAVSELVQSSLFAMQSYMGDPLAVGGKRSAKLDSLAAGLDLPEYYLHDFHSLPGGFLNPEHAKVYDALSESVFVGAHRMGRRMMLRPIHEAIAARGPAHKGGKGMRLLDIGTGPGSFLVQAQEAFPALELGGIDLSPAMLTVAASTVPAHPSVRGAAAAAPRFERASMEAIPEEAGALDFVTHANCFHEMPLEAIQRTLREVLRVLKPGGLLVHMDAVQARDDQSVSDSARVNFDGRFVEPYIRHWMHHVDLDQACLSAGFEIAAAPRPFFVSTLRVYRKPLD